MTYSSASPAMSSLPDQTARKANLRILSFWWVKRWLKLLEPVQPLVS